MLPDEKLNQIINFCKSQNFEISTIEIPEAEYARLVSNLVKFSEPAQRLGLPTPMLYNGVYVYASPTTSKIGWKISIK